MIIALQQAKRKSVLAIILLLSLISILSGCWNRRELDELGIIGAVAFDLDKENVELIFEVIKPQALRGGGDKGSVKEEYTFVQSTGRTFFDAIRNSTLKFDRKLFWPHTKVYIFSEEFARKGLITDYIDYFQRDHEARMAVHLVIAKDTPVSEIIGISGGIEEIPSDYLESLLKAQKANSKAVLVRLRDFLDTYYSEEIQPVMGVVQKVPKVETGVVTEGDKKEYEILDEGSAVFLYGKMVGFLDGTETRGFNFVTGKAKSGIIVSQAPDDGLGMNSVEIIKAKSNNDVEIEGDHAIIKVKIYMEGMLGEEWGKVDVGNPDVMEKISSANSRVIKKQVEELIKKVQQEYRSDIFGFGRTVHKKYPPEWEKIKNKWNDIFSVAEVSVEVKTEITRIGLVSETAK